MNKDFEEGLELGVLASWYWYLLWFGLAFYAGAKTHNITYIFGMLSAGWLAGLFLKDVTKLFILKE
jgi:hypothetical protein